MRRITLTDEEVEFVATLFDGVLEHAAIGLQSKCSTEERMSHRYNQTVFTDLKHKLETAERV